MNRCFVCGPDNPEGLRLKFAYDPKKHSVETRAVIDPRYQGATGYSHGGMIATLLDEAMAKANGLGGIKAVTLRITVTYRKMVPVSTELRLSAHRVRRRGRKLYLQSQLHDNAGQLLAEAHALFLEVPRSNMSI